MSLQEEIAMYEDTLLKKRLDAIRLCISGLNAINSDFIGPELNEERLAVHREASTLYRLLSAEYIKRSKLKIGTYEGDSKQ